MEVFRPEAVLIVDADDQYVRTLTRELRTLGFPFIYRASSALQAMAMLDRVHPTLVLTTIVEHERCGRAIIARAKQLGASVAVIGSRLELLTEEFETPLQDKTTLVGTALETLVLELIHKARSRSRDSLTMRRTRVA